MAKDRDTVTAQTVGLVSRQMTGHPLEAERAAAYAEALEPMLQQIETLRRLPLKDVEPAVVFQPVERGRHD